MSSTTVRLTYNNQCDRTNNSKTISNTHAKRNNANSNEKTTRRRRKHCALAVVRRSQKISPAADPLLWGAGRPKFNQLGMFTIFTYKASLVSTQFRVIVVTDPAAYIQTYTHTDPQTDRTDYSTLRRS